MARRGRPADPPEEKKRKHREKQAGWLRRYRRLREAVPLVLAARTLGEAKRIVREADAPEGEEAEGASS